MNLRWMGIVGWLLVLGMTPRALGVTPSIWRENTQVEFQKGRPEGVSIGSEGELSLAPALEEVADLEELYVWALAMDGKGVLYAGTGNEGKIFKISPKGEWTVLFDSPEVGIQSLTLDEKGDLYAGSSPDGIIYRIQPDGSVSTFARSGARYVWALTFGADGRLYAATGGGGGVLRLDSDGKAEQVLDSSEDHIMCLVRDGQGGFYAGSAGDGLIYHLDGKGKAYVLYDAPEKEIHALVVEPDGTLYAGAMNGATASGTSGKTTEGSPPTGASPSSGPSPPPKGCAVYEIKGPAVRRIWSGEPSLLLSMAVAPAPSGRGKAIWSLLVGTGREGKLYAVSPDGRFSLLAQLKEAQPLSMVVNDGGKVFIGTGDVGKVYRLGVGFAKEGTFESQVHDAGMISQWGRVSWRADVPKGAKVTVATRSGNREKPDETWSEWSGEMKDGAGSRVESPPGRFIQYRVSLSSSERMVSPMVKEVAISGLQTNLKPEITMLSSYPYRGPKQTRGGQGAPSSQNSGQRPQPAMKKSLRMIEWRAEDPNGDRLVYALYFKGVDEKVWKLLKKDLKGNAYLWDTESVAEGDQVLKVVASDRMSNPLEVALKTEKVTKPFLVDHTGPSVMDLNAERSSEGRIRIKGRAVDAVSPLKEAAYSVDGGDWIVVFPTDGIFDSKDEPFSATTASLSAEEHVIVVRAMDVMENVGTGRMIVEGVRE